MVRVLASGDIVPDDDPRVRTATGRPNVNVTTPGRPRLAFVNNANNGVPHGGGGAAGGGVNVSVFDSISQRLSAAGVPTWHLGPYTVEPVVSLGFLLSLFLMGFPGLLFSGFLFFVAKYSQHGWSRDNNPRTDTGPTSDSGPPPTDRGNWPGAGHRLGQ